VNPTGSCPFLQSRISLSFYLALSFTFYNEVRTSSYSIYYYGSLAVGLIAELGVVIIDIINKFLKDHVFWFLLHRYFGKTHILFLGLDYFNTITTKDGLTYKVSQMGLGDVASSLTDYEFNDIQKTDIVLDIGAGCGGFALPAAKKAKWVYAFEPIFASELEMNIQLNHIENVTVFPFALGDGSKELIKYCGNEIVVKSVTFPQIIEMCGSKIDFFKCDCEGGEWNIKPEMLSGIRRLEFELHNTKNKNPLFLKVLERGGYRIKEIAGPNNFAYSLVHGYLGGYEKSDSTM